MSGHNTNSTTTSAQNQNDTVIQTKFFKEVTVEVITKAMLGCWILLMRRKLPHILQTVSSASATKALSIVETLLFGLYFSLPNTALLFNSWTLSEKWPGTLSNEYHKHCMCSIAWDSHPTLPLVFTHWTSEGQQQQLNQSYGTSDWIVCQRAVSVCPRLHISFQCPCPASETSLPINTRPRILLLV